MRRFVLALALILGLSACPARTAAPPAADGHTGSSTAAAGGCRRTGCSSEVCSDQDVVTACMMRPEFACYHSASCDRQAGGACGWVMTDELQRCLDHAKTEPVQDAPQ